MNSSGKIKIAFFDIDGTLLSFNTHRIPDSAMSAIRAMSDRGIENVRKDCVGVSAGA